MSFKEVVFYSQTAFITSWSLCVITHLRFSYVLDLSVAVVFDWIYHKFVMYDWIFHKQQGSTFLSELEQSPPKAMLEAMQPLQSAIVKPELLKHQDREVKLLVATCICEITRITAPEAPYSDDVLKVISNGRDSMTHLRALDFPIEQLKTWFVLWFESGHLPFDCEHFQRLRWYK